MPAELAVLNLSLRDKEAGVWLNSRGKKTGVIDLNEITAGKFETVRFDLPKHVQQCLKSFYDNPEVSKGVYDLMLWSTESDRIRFIEVKCPHWDKPTKEQEVFSGLAREKGIETSIAEWEFSD